MVLVGSRCSTFPTARQNSTPITPGRLITRSRPNLAGCISTRCPLQAVSHRTRRGFPCFVNSSFHGLALARCLIDDLHIEKLLPYLIFNHRGLTCGNYGVFSLTGFTGNNCVDVQTFRVFILLLLALLQLILNSKRHHFEHIDGG